jgi:predicted amidohydrolase YtcJ
MADNAEAWMRRTHAGTDVGTDSLRVEFGIYEEDLDAAIDRGFHTGDRLSDLVTVGNLKVLTDGSLNTRTAYCYDEYPGLSRNANGLLTVAPDRLEELIRRAADAGIHSSVHAIGDHANTLALDAFERVGTAGRIEHAQLLATADIPRFARLGVVASVQPDHAMDDQDVAEHYWPGRTDRAFPLRSLLDAGASLVFGSDAPVSPLDPWSAIAAAVTRTRDGRQPWHPEQCISVQEAIRASVRTRIRVGEPADLVALDRDPLAASSGELRGMPVAATILGGRFTHSVL